MKFYFRALRKYTIFLIISQLDLFDFLACFKNWIVWIFFLLVWVRCFYRVAFNKLKAWFVDDFRNTNQISFNLAHNNYIFGICLSDDVDNFANNFCIYLRLSKYSCIFYCVLNKRRSINNSTTSSILNFKLARKVWENALVNLIEFLQLFL